MFVYSLAREVRHKIEIALAKKKCLFIQLFWQENCDIKYLNLERNCLAKKSVRKRQRDEREIALQTCLFIKTRDRAFVLQSGTTSPVMDFQVSPLHFSSIGR